MTKRRSGSVRKVRNIDEAGSAPLPSTCMLRGDVADHEGVDELRKRSEEGKKQKQYCEELMLLRN